MNMEQLERMRTGKGFIAALDQSGGSTPKALQQYGIGEDAYSDDEAMFALVHEMRTRIITSPSFTSEYVLAAILFENTMDRTIDDQLTADYLWNTKGIIPILKVDKGLADVANGVQLMKPIADLDDLLKRAVARNIFGTKMRSVIKESDSEGIRAIVDQQFSLGKAIVSHGLVPILEPEVDIHSTDKKESETILRQVILEYLDQLEDHELVMFKLTIPDVDDFYAELISHPNVVRVVALSGGYTRADANEKLARNHGLIASFSRALSQGLSAQQSSAEFDAMLKESIASIYDASLT